MSTEESPTLGELERWLAGTLDAERSDAIARRLEHDDRLAARVAALDQNLALAAELHGALGGQAPTATDAPWQEGPPALDDYEIEGEIARGGQGVVYRARQLSTRRDVALKVVHAPSSRTGIDQGRFEREVDLAASLGHPHLVKVFDRGATDDGRPYVVMELVDGRPVDEALGPSADLTARLRLFDKLCAAIAYAHRHGVIHRDLKPANVLVDGDGEPRVLDFGLAKTLDAADQTEITAPGTFVGTLAFAAPEQLGHDSAPDARADVYALGVILYRLLTGRHPFPTDGPLASVVRWILEHDPPPPGSVLPRPPGRRLDEDLDALVLTCLAKDPDQRYPTVEALRADLERWHARAPLAARADRRGYLLRKTLQRYRLPLAALAVVMAALVTATWISTEALSDSRKQADRVVDMNEFLVDSLTEAAPGLGPRDRTISEWMRQAALTLDERFADAPLSEATLRLAIARALQLSGDPDGAAHHAARALRLFEEQTGPEGPECLAARLVLAAVTVDRGQLDEAETRLIALQADADRLLAPADVGRARIVRARANLLATRRRSEEITTELRQLVDTLTRAHGSLSPIVLSLRDALATNLRATGDHEQAVAMWGQLVELHTRQRGPADGKTLMARYKLGNELVDLGRFDEALEILSGLTADYADVYGPHDDATLQLRVSRAGTLKRLRRRNEALSELLEVADLCREHLGDRHHVTLQALHGLGAVLRLVGQLDAAVGILTQAREGLLANLGPAHTYSIQVTVELAVAHQSLGAAEVAEDLLRQCLEACEPVRPLEDEDLTIGLIVWAGLRLDQGQPLQAADGYARVVERYRASRGPEAGEAWRYHAQRGRALAAAGQASEARPILEQAWHGLAAARGVDDVLTRGCAAELAALPGPFVEAERERWRLRSTGIDPQG